MVCVVPARGNQGLRARRVFKTSNDESVISQMHIFFALGKRSSGSGDNLSLIASSLAHFTARCFSQRCGPASTDPRGSHSSPAARGTPGDPAVRAPCAILAPAAGQKQEIPELSGAGLLSLPWSRNPVPPQIPILAAFLSCLSWAGAPRSPTPAPLAQNVPLTLLAGGRVKGQGRENPAKHSGPALVFRLLCLFADF